MKYFQRYLQSPNLYENDTFYLHKKEEEKTKNIKATKKKCF